MSPAVSLIAEDILVKRLYTLGLLALISASLLSSPALAQTPAAPAAPAQTTPAKPPTSKQYLTLGKYYYYVGQYDSAYYAFRKALDLDPKSNDSLLGLGRTQLRLRLYSASIESFKKLIQTDSRNTSAYIALSQAYKDQFSSSDDPDTVKTNLDDALRVLKDAEALKPSDVALSAIYNQRALIYAGKKDLPKALEAAAQAARLSPDDDVVLSNQASLLYQSGKTDEALTTLARAVALNPRDAVNRAFLGKLMVQSGKGKEGLTELSRAMRLSPKNAYVLGQYGIAKYVVKEGRDVDAAKKSLEGALQGDSLRYPEFYAYLGRIYLDKNDAKNAKANLAKAVALEPTQAEYRLYYGKALAANGDRTEAQKQFNEALRLDPNFKDAKDALAQLK